MPFSPWIRNGRNFRNSEIMGTPNSSEGVALTIALTVPGKSFGKQVHNLRIEDPRCWFAAWNALSIQRAWFFFGEKMCCLMFCCFLFMFLLEGFFLPFKYPNHIGLVGCYCNLFLSAHHGNHQSFGEANGPNPLEQHQPHPLNRLDVRGA